MRKTLLVPLVLLPAALLAACTPGSTGASPSQSQPPAASQTTGQDTTPSPTGAPTGTPGQPASGSSATSQAGPRSQYSSLKAEDCTLVASFTEGSGADYDCAGAGEVDLRLRDFDARMTLDVLYPELNEQPLDFGTVVSGAFNDLGEKAEWRFPAGVEHPTALIVRFNAYEFPDQPDRTNSYLVVARLAPEGSCVVAKIPPGAQQNEKARAVADDLDGRDCLPRLG